LKLITQNGQTWAFALGPFGELVRVQEPSGTVTWFAEDVSPAGLLRRSEYAAPSAAPREEYAYIGSGAFAARDAAQPLYWLKTPFSPVLARATLPGIDGNAQVASASGGLVSDEFRDAFGRILAQSGSVFPRQRYRAMDQLANLEVALGGVSTAAAMLGGDALYSSETGALLCDPGFGPDGDDGVCRTGEESCRDPGEGGSRVGVGYVASDARVGVGFAGRPAGMGLGRAGLPASGMPWGWIEVSTGTESYYAWVDPPPKARLPIAVQGRRRGVGQTMAYESGDCDPGPFEGGPPRGRGPGGPGWAPGPEDPPPPFPDPVRMDAADFSQALSLSWLRWVLSLIGQDALLAQIP
jgi:hypothetical protein